jgi:hypothetical protein
VCFIDIAEKYKTMIMGHHNREKKKEKNYKTHLVGLGHRLPLEKVYITLQPMRDGLHNPKPIKWYISPPELCKIDQAP